MKNQTTTADWQTKRLAELEKYPLDLAVPDPFLDGIASRFMKICETTTVIISFFGNSPSLVKAWAGEEFVPDAKTMFCDLALHRGGYVEVEDTLQHPSFKNNPAVIGSETARFFSSTPLVSSNGFVLGSLCALNRKPLRFSRAQRAGIVELGSTVVHYLESKRLGNDERDS